MQSFLFQTSSLLAVAGIGSTAFGLLAEQAKLLVLGFVLVLGAGVFATLYLGNCKASRQSDKDNTQG
jgi:hypothetical protein